MGEEFLILKSENHRSATSLLAANHFPPDEEGRIWMVVCTDRGESAFGR
jgi:hypothetical protein